MKAWIIRALRLVAYPAFYVFCLLFFGYLAFPFSRLKDRVIAEFQRRARPGQRLELDHVGAYWFTGVEVSGVRLILPKESKPAMGFPAAAEKDSKAKETVITLDEAHARIKILPLLIGRVKLSFFLAGLGGEIKGVFPIMGTSGDIEVDVENVEIGRVDPLVAAIGGVPLRGAASGHVALSPENGKLSHGTGSVDVTVKDVVVSDGKTKIQGLLELPAAHVGDLKLAGEAKDGVLTLTTFEATGTDIKLQGAGKVSFKDNWQNSLCDLFVRFIFTDAYRGKNETLKGLLGAPGSTSGGLIETTVPKMKRAKRPDGYYGFHMHGPLKKLAFDASLADGPGAPGAPATVKTPPKVPAKRVGVAPNNPFNTRAKPALGTPPRAAFPAMPSMGRMPALTAEPAPAPAPAPEPAAAEPEPAPAPEPAPEEAPQGE